MNDVQTKLCGMIGRNRLVCSLRMDLDGFARDDGTLRRLMGDAGFDRRQADAQTAYCELLEIGR